MRWGCRRKLEYSLFYDERNDCWKVHVQTSNRHRFTKRFQTCKQANDWYVKWKEDYCRVHGIN